MSLDDFTTESRLYDLVEMASLADNAVREAISGAAVKDGKTTEPIAEDDITSALFAVTHLNEMITQLFDDFQARWTAKAEAA